jgi:hypothetical protein
MPNRPGDGALYPGARRPHLRFGSPRRVDDPVQNAILQVIVRRVPGPTPRLAILFWFYKEEALCRDRLGLLRRLHPETPIYGLYGGPLPEASRFEAALPELDDFWAFPDVMPSYWSWRNGDLLIRRWHESRGQQLMTWDTIFVAQWDLLVTEPIHTLVPVQPDEFVVSGLRPINEVEPWWMWTQGEHRAEYEEFMAHVRRDLDYAGSAYACQFVAAFLPRSFLDRYVGLDSPELGFIEYKLPTYAAAFGNTVTRSPRLEVWWIEDPATAQQNRASRLLKAGGAPIRLRWVKTHATHGIYHPYEALYPDGLGPTSKAIMAELTRDASLLASHPLRSLRAP